MQRIGIYSGTFDPIHRGHIAFALAAQKNCQLDFVIFLPEASPRHKVAVSSLINRKLQITRAIKDIDILRLQDISESQFSVGTTMHKLLAIFPNAAFTFLLGSDVAKHFGKWPDVIQLLKECDFAIGMRHGDTDSEISTVLGQIEKSYGIPIKYRLIRTEHADEASTQYRNRIIKK